MESNDLETLQEQTNKLIDDCYPVEGATERQENRPRNLSPTSARSFIIGSWNNEEVG